MQLRLLLPIQHLRVRIPTCSGSPCALPPKKKKENLNYFYWNLKYQEVTNLAADTTQNKEFGVLCVSWDCWESKRQERVKSKLRLKTFWLQQQPNGSELEDIHVATSVIKHRHPSPPPNKIHSDNLYIAGSWTPLNPSCSETFGHPPFSSDQGLWKKNK